MPVLGIAGVAAIDLCQPLRYSNIHIAIRCAFPLQEIDGKALLLLNSDMMMKYMNLKLGPALKICNLVSRVNGRRHVSL